MTNIHRHEEIEMGITIRTEYRVETRQITEGAETGWYPEGGRIFSTHEKAQELLEERSEWLGNPSRFEHRVVGRAVSDWAPVVPIVRFPS